MRVALDFDGTLCDSMGVLEDLAVELVCEAYPWCTEDTVRQRYRKTAGLPFDEQVAWFPIPGPEKQVVRRKFAELKVRATLLSKPFGDVVDVLHAWYDRGVVTCIVSSTTKELITTWLSWHRLDGYFVGEVYGIDFGSKPVQLELADVDLFIADAPRDLDLAAAAKVQFAGLQRDPDLLPDRLAVSRSLAELSERVVLPRHDRKRSRVEQP